MSFLAKTEKEIQMDNILGCLNSAYKADPGAMHALLCNIAPANQNLVDHPHVVVEMRLKGLTTVGMLGVINGVLTSMGFTRIATKFSDTKDENGQYEFLGFVRYEENPQNP